MINCLCVIQQGQGPDQQRDELAAALNTYTEAHFADSVQVNWLPVPEGGGFTAGKPSTSSVVSMTANENLPQARRETLLRELVALWTNKTGCSIDEIVAVIADPAAA